MFKLKMEIIPNEQFGYGLQFTTNDSPDYYCLGHLTLDEIESLELQLAEIVMQLYQYRHACKDKQ